ncbi:SCO family protein [Alteromonas pelagimontana]|uniref:SCO family protein n=1 Tax=Alteromonas pelagimontana TaxID=1858656 RepID=A0A6M4MCC6_9ALTE|nr:SCO family protein [Alteromonas pelagimontana]QJR80854.1 SCO family protein [Alteromonas pelagimontana]
MNQRAVAGIAAAVALVIGIIGAIYIAPPNVTDPSDTEYLQRYPEPRRLSDFTLTDHKGQPFTSANLKGKWTLAFMGYTYCPDICPTTLANLNQIYPELAAIKSDSPVQVLFISVDPKRDSSERLGEYIGFFSPDFIAATGNHDQLFPLVRSMGMMYAIAESTENSDYLVDHSASIVLIDPTAKVIGRFKPVLEPGKMAVSDAQQILADMPKIMKTG